MKLVAALVADFESTFLGGRSRLLRPLGDSTVLGHALRRLARVEGVAQRVLCVRPRDAAPAQAALAASGVGDRVELLPIDAGRRPRRELFRSARKWNLASWRGGPLSATWFDEYVEPTCVAQIMDACDAAAVLIADGHQPLLDPAIGHAMLSHFRNNEKEARLVFTQAPPGLAGVLLTRSAIGDLLERQIPLGILLGYRPEMPQGDPITRVACLQLPAHIAQTQARFVADTQRASNLIEQAVGELGPDADASAICLWTRGADRDRAGSLPLEVEIELTTDDPLPETILRPRGPRVPRRCIENLDALARVAAELATLDDRLVFLGGLGDPLLHPQFAEVLGIVRRAGICGLGVATTGAALSDSAFEALFEHRVDLVQVLLDAHGRETYARVHRRDAYDAVMANIARIEAARRERVRPQPLILCSLTRHQETIGELEPFFDHWTRAAGTALISPYRTFGGRLPADSLISVTPPVRQPCRRLSHRLVLLADGTVRACDERIDDSIVLGYWNAQSLSEIWTGPELAKLRARHASGDLREIPQCTACDQWFRP